MSGFARVGNRVAVVGDKTTEAAQGHSVEGLER